MVAISLTVSFYYGCMLWRQVTASGDGGILLSLVYLSFFSIRHPHYLEEGLTALSDWRGRL